MRVLAAKVDRLETEAKRINAQAECDRRDWRAKLPKDALHCIELSLV